ncbi:MAG: flagellar export protein FliJ [Steroidobacteraceae bacterium]
MTRSGRLKPIAEVAARDAEAAARAVTEARNALASEEARLADLAGYRRQYDASQATEGMTLPFSLANRHAFAAQLDEALRLQEQRVVACRAELERRVEEWSALRRHGHAMERLVGRCAGEEAREAERSEQRSLDDSSVSRQVGATRRD